MFITRDYVTRVKSNRKLVFVDSLRGISRPLLRRLIISWTLIRHIRKSGTLFVGVTSTLSKIFRGRPPAQGAALNYGRRIKKEEIRLRYP